MQQRPQTFTLEPGEVLPGVDLVYTVTDPNEGVARRLDQHVCDSGLRGHVRAADEVDVLADGWHVFDTFVGAQRLGHGAEESALAAAPAERLDARKPLLRVAVEVKEASEAFVDRGDRLVEVQRPARRDGVEECELTRRAALHASGHASKVDDHDAHALEGGQWTGLSLMLDAVQN